MTQAPTKKNAPTIKDAADRLQRTLKNLEVTLEPMLERVKELEQTKQDVRSNDADRSRLAGELDELQAKHDGLLAREQEFSKLAGETTEELDAVISQVLQALDGEGR
ncbi:MAG: hypothetical protein COA91_10245 [Robiginitomaculum sp.]|nr:MAG: hypothetical protein COA91_10245 [Robiginitomaculum sp.]